MENTPLLMESRMQKCNLKGPFSSLEMKVYGKIRTLQGKPIKIEDDSVNSVLLDDQPGDPHERLLVAASVRSFFTRLIRNFFLLIRLVVNRSEITRPVTRSLCVVQLSCQIFTVFLLFLLSFSPHEPSSALTRSVPDLSVLFAVLVTTPSETSPFVLIVTWKLHSIRKLITK